MRATDLLPVIFLAFAFAAGCSVPVRPGPDREVRNLEESHRLASELAGSDPGAALPKLKEVEVAARRVAATLLIGDPRRERADRVLAEARGARKRLEEALGDDTEARMEEALRRRAETAIEQGRDSKQEVKGRPADIEADMSIVNKAVGSPGRRAVSVAAVKRDADADLDRLGVAPRGGDEREGDIEPDELDREKKRKERKGRAPLKPRLKFSLPVTVWKIESKGKSIVVYLVLLSKNTDAQVASVTGKLLDEDGKTVARIMAAYLGKDFKPNWDDIYSSFGKAITPEAAIVAEADKPLFLVAVSDSSKAKKAKTAKMTVTTMGGRTLRGTGP